MTEENIFLRLVKEGKIEFTEDGKLIGFSEYAIFLPVRVLNRLFIILKENFGENKAEEILKEFGIYHIKQAFQRYVKILNWKELPKDKILEFFKDVTRLGGFGRYELRKIDDSYVISIEKTPLAEEFLLEYGKQEKPVDYYLVGCWESAFTSLLGNPMICEETKCYAKGDDCCEFVVRPKEETKNIKTK